MFEGQVDSPKKINLLYDEVEQHYHVIVKLTGAMAKKYVCKACNKGCTRDFTHMCDQTYRDCLASPPCALSAVTIPCSECNRHFRNEAFFVNHKPSSSNNKSVFERRRICATCGARVTRGNHECNKRYCEICNKNRNVGHLCFIRTLKDVLPANANNVLYVFYDFETTQIKMYSNTAKEHVPNLVCVQQFSASCEKTEDFSIDCDRCDRRRHTFSNDPKGDLLTHLCEPRPWPVKCGDSSQCQSIRFSYYTK